MRLEMNTSLYIAYKHNMGIAFLCKDILLMDYDNMLAAKDLGENIVTSGEWC